MQHSALKHSLANDLGVVQGIATRLARTPDELAENLREIVRLVASIDFDRYDPADVRREAQGLMVALFETRVFLHDEIDRWHRGRYLTRDVQHALRDVFRLTRYATDMLGEIAIHHRRLVDGEATYRGFTGPDFNTLGHPSIPSGAQVPFEPGDVLLMRGMAANSAAIARIGDIDSQFSHVGIVHIDKRGRHLITEALIEEGAIVNDLEHTLDHGLGRCVVFRHKDAALAAKAGQKIHDYVSRTLTSGIGRPIAYDFSMEMKDYRQLFCSKLVRQAFDMASDGKLLLSTHKTSLVMKNRDFFKRIGVTAKETFAPGDMELEPNFKLVAEWADYRVTSGLRLADLTMDKFFEWMDRYGYRFKETFAINLISYLGRFAGLLSNDAKNLIADVIPKVPANMRRRTIATVAMLHKTTEEVVGELRELEQRSKELTDRPLHPREVYQALEAIRETRGKEIGYLVRG